MEPCPICTKEHSYKQAQMCYMEFQSGLERGRIPSTDINADKFHKAQAYMHKIESIMYSKTKNK